MVVTEVKKEKKGMGGYEGVFKREKVTTRKSEHQEQVFEGREREGW